MQDMSENGADINHLNVVHVPTMLAGSTLNSSELFSRVMKHVWKGQWTACEEKGKKHMAIINVSYQIQLFNFSLPLATVNVRAVQVCNATYLKALS